MKINPILTLITFAIAALAAYGFFAWNETRAFPLLVSIGAGLSIFLTLGGVIALSSERLGTVGNIRVLSIVFLVIMLLSQVLFSAIGFTKPTAYIVVNGILLLVYFLAGYAVNRAINR